MDPEKGERSSALDTVIGNALDNAKHECRRKQALHSDFAH